MTQPETILKLIETADPANKAELDKIDWMVTDYLEFSHEWHHERSRSRDALKARLGVICGVE